jgi:hypothetical protein
MSIRVLFVVWIALGSLLITACAGSSSLAAAPNGDASRPVAPPPPAVTRTPSGIFFSTSVPPTALPAIAPTTLEVDSNAVIVQGRVYDADAGQRLSNATLEWQFVAQDWQRYNGQLQVPDDGLYRLLLPIREQDEVIITARVPGYLSSTARLLGKQLSRYGSRLNFGLIKTDSPVPTLPGALGTIQVSGLVYDSTRGLKGPIANARVTLVDRSLVQPGTQIEATTNLTGTFVIPVALHSTDQLDVTITASGYQTVTLTKRATELARKPQLLIGLRPVPNP